VTTPRLRGLSNRDTCPSEAVVTADLAAAIVAIDGAAWEYSVEELIGEDQPDAVGAWPNIPDQRRSPVVDSLHRELDAPPRFRNVL
jgi:hypothetical protein